MIARAASWAAALREDERLRLARGIACAVLAVYVAYHMTKFRPFWPTSFTQDGLGDFSILIDDGSLVATTGRTRAALSATPERFFFPYTPPASILFFLYGHLGPGLAFWGFWLVKAASVFAIVWAGLGFAGARGRPAAWLAALAALLAADYFVHYDLRQQNINLVYVAVVALGLLPATPAALAGVLLALACTFKLYSFVFVPWLHWRGRHRAAAVCVAALALLWIALPLAWFGFAGTLQVYRDWLEEIRKSGTMAIFTAPAPLITLRHFLAGTFDLPPFAPETARLLLALQMVWLALVAAYFWLTRPQDVPSPLQDGADAAVLMMLPLPFSTILQPTHGAPTLLAFVMLAAAALEPARPRGIRIALAGSLAAAMILRRAMDSWALRGGMTYLVLCIGVAGLGVLLLAERRAGNARG